MTDLGRSHGVQIDFECRRHLRLSGFTTFFLGLARTVTKTPSPTRCQSRQSCQSPVRGRLSLTDLSDSMPPFASALLGSST